AGYRDAFQVEVLPEDADPMDVRYNVIQWVHRSTRGWSYGSSVVDPRTGEILKGHVTLGSLRVRQDLLIARGMTSPFEEDGDGAGDVQAQEMAIARIRQLSAHEVGHTLGLAHNFAASARSRASVMDYPYMDLRLADDGNVSLSDAYATGIGDWDKRSILYGYAQFDDDAEIDSLDAIIRENGELGFEFISDPDSRSIRDFHPRSHLWDNGADAVEQLELTMRLRAAALNKFGARAIPETAPYSDLQEAIVPVYLFHRYQVEAAGKLLGGADYSYALRTDDIDQPVTPVPADRQRDALYALLDTLDVTALALPDELIAQIPPKAYGYRRTRESAPSRTGALFDPVTLAEVAIEQTLSVLLHPERLARLQLQSALDPRQVSASEVMENLHTRVLRVEYEVLPGAIARRAGSAILRHWRALLVADDVAPEVQAASRAALLRAQRLFESQRGSREPYRSYYQHEAWLIERLFENPATGTRSKPAPIPPGSPVGSDH
ncbi:MAG: zinc-dependent metalloprotease, partial [Pseudomonadota bacterium]